VIALVMRLHPHRAFPRLGRMVVRCLALEGFTFSRVVASGKPGAFRSTEITLFSNDKTFYV
jgi:hypothetical protein